MTGQTAIQMQEQFNTALFIFGIGFLTALGVTVAVLFRVVVPRMLTALVKRREIENSKLEAAATNEAKRQRELFEEELAKRRQEREMEREQQGAQWQSMTTVLNAHLEGSRNFATLSGRMLDEFSKMTNELHGNRTVLTDVSDTVDQIRTEWDNVKSQIESIAVGVQHSTAASNASSASSSATQTMVSQMLASIDAFSRKLDNLLTKAKHDTGELPTLAEIKPEVSQ